jgi:glycine cleavage system H protein
MAYPEAYRYTKEHEWIDAASGMVGITKFAADQLGDIVFVEMPPIGSKYEKGKVFGSVESVKSVSELYLPVSGKVIALNDELTDFPEGLNEDAHEAWIVKVELANPAELDQLLSASDYEKYVQEEAG